MEFKEEWGIVNQVLFILTEIDKQLGKINVQTPPELRKVKNILLNKEINRFNSIRRKLYEGFRRLDEMGVNDHKIDHLSSKIYLFVKSYSFFDAV